MIHSNSPILDEVVPGDRVLYLGSGAGETCCELARAVGEAGSVIGIEMNVVLLSAAGDRRREFVAESGWDNIRFLRGWTHDLATDPGAVEAWLRERPVGDLAGWRGFEEFREAQRIETPLVATGSVDLVVAEDAIHRASPARRVEILQEVSRVLHADGKGMIRLAVIEGKHSELEGKVRTEFYGEGLDDAPTMDCLVQTVVESGFRGMDILRCAVMPEYSSNGAKFRMLTAVLHKNTSERGESSEEGAEFRYRLLTPCEPVINEPAESAPGSAQVCCRRDGGCC